MSTKFDITELHKKRMSNNSTDIVVNSEPNADGEYTVDLLIDKRYCCNFPTLRKANNWAKKFADSFADTFNYNLNIKVI